MDRARTHGMEPLVEVHTEEELTGALKTDARIIGINNRNLDTLEVEMRAGADALLVGTALMGGPKRLGEINHRW